jgi:hypothetical protein
VFVLLDTRVRQSLYHLLEGKKQSVRRPLSVCPVPAIYHIISRSAVPAVSSARSARSARSAGSAGSVRSVRSVRSVTGRSAGSVSRVGQLCQPVRPSAGSAVTVRTLTELEPVFQEEHILYSTRKHAEMQYLQYRIVPHGREWTFGRNNTKLGCFPVRNDGALMHISRYFFSTRKY